MPTWSHLHPLIVHFPIALLLVAPLLVLLGLLWPVQRTGIHAAALFLLLLGTSLAVLAVSTGMAAAGAAGRIPELLLALDSHELLAKQVAILYSGLSLAFVGIHLWSRRRRQGTRSRWLIAVHLLWLAASLGASILLIRTGHLGGRMVHELGFHARAVPAIQSRP
jgi:uncharacterized membrane protein